MSDEQKTTEVVTEKVVETPVPAPLGTATEAYRNDPVQDPRAALPVEKTVETTTETTESDSSDS